MTGQPTLLTVILNFRTPEMTLDAARAALRELDGIAGEIVIVDNDSGDGSYDVIAEGMAREGWDPARIRLVASGRNGGFGAGNNVAMRAGLADGSKPDYVFLLNSDAEPDAGAIHALVDFMEAHPKAGMAGSFIHGLDGAPHQTAFRFPTIAGELEGAARTGIFTKLFKNSVVPLPLPETQVEVDWVAGASVLMRQTMLDEIGLFDETFFLYYEETDLCLRARRAGWEIHYIPESRVTHIGSVSTGMKTWARTPAYWFDSRRHYFTKNHGRAYAAIATLARLGGGLVWQARIALQGKDPADPPRFLRDLLAHWMRPAPRTKPGVGDISGRELKSE